MNTTRRGVLAGTALGGLGLLTMPGARAQSAGKPIKIGVLNDLSGVYRDTGGLTAIACAQQAAAEFGDQGFKVEVISADHQNKPDVGVSIARQWFDRDGVDMILDVPTSSVALAVAGVCREKNKAYINTGAGTVELTGGQCSPNTVHWVYDTYMLARSTGGATVKDGGDSWFFITADYAFGKDLQKQTEIFVKQGGGKVLGSVAYPFPSTTDFSSYVVQAQASGAKVIGLANAGADTVNCIKQLSEFGINQSKTRIAAMLMFINDVNALGLQTAQGLVLTEAFYWDLNDRTRAFMNRVKPRVPKNWPNMEQAANYSATLHYLKTVKEMGVDAAKASGAETVARMKKMPTEDDALGQGQIREDGRRIQPVYLFQVKKPSESKGPWDYYKLLQTTPADQAFRPMSEGHCSFIKS